MPSSSSILDLGCGTGRDALLLQALGYRVTGMDSSPEMVATAVRQGAAAVVGELADPKSWPTLQPDGVLSNFGALNCVEDLEPIGRALAARLKPESVVVLVLLSRCCPMERFAFLRARKLKGAIRGRRSGLVELEGIPVPVWYGGVERLISWIPWFKVEKIEGLGILLSPPLFRKNLPAMLSRLDALVAPWPVLKRLGDHQLVVLRRKHTNSP
jgi:SAM-dependent methyltransferase